MVTVGSAHKHFQYGRGVYVCQTCGRRTRETTVSGSDDCEQCFELAGLQNAKWDGCYTEADNAERDRRLKLVVDRGGNKDRVLKSFKDLFEE